MGRSYDNAEEPSPKTCRSRSQSENKCFIGYYSIGFNGHMVGNGTVRMEEERLTRIKQAGGLKTN